MPQIAGLRKAAPLRSPRARFSGCWETAYFGPPKWERPWRCRGFCQEAQAAGDGTGPAPASEKPTRETVHEGSKGSPASSVTPPPATRVSLFWRHLRAGDRAFLAGDQAGAKSAFEAAVKADPTSVVGHARLAQLFIAQEHYGAARERIDVGIGFAKTTEGKFRLLFLKVLLFERQKMWSKALDALRLLKSHPKADSARANSKPVGAIVASVADHNTRVTAQIARENDYSAVRDRIAERERILEMKIRGR